MKNEIVKKIGSWFYKPMVILFRNTGIRRVSWINTLNNNIRKKLKPDYIITKKFGFKMFLDKVDSLHLSVNRDWEPFETKLIKENIKQGDVVIDIGANIGFYTLIMCKLVGENGRVYAFEADPENYDILKKNIEINGFKNAILVNKAVSLSNGKKNFYINPSHTAGNSFLKNPKNKKIEVDTIKLDDYFLNNEIINFIKMDIEGAEGAATIGMRDLLKRSKDIIILTEFSPSSMDKIDFDIKLTPNNYLKLIKDLNFEIYEINENTCKKTITTIEELLDKYPITGDKFTNLFCKKISN